MKQVLGDDIERVDAVAGGFYVRPAIVEVEAQDGSCAEGDVRADPLRHALSRTRRSDRAPQCGAAGPVVIDFHHRSARGRAVRLRRPGPTAASPTSTSARRARRSAERSAARRRPAAGAKAARTAGAPTCGGRPTRSIMVQTCRSLRESASTSPHRASFSSAMHRRPGAAEVAGANPSAPEAPSAARSDSPEHSRSRAPGRGAAGRCVSTPSAVAVRPSPCARSMTA